MYVINDELLASVEAFIGKIPDSIVKSHYEKWLAEIRPTQRATAEQMEKFVSFAGQLPKETQTFPQSFAHSVKNAAQTEKREVKEGITETADLAATIDKSIEGVPDAATAPQNQEETLHKLNTLEGSKGGKPLSKSAPAGSKKKATAKTTTKEVAKPKTVSKPVVKPALKPVKGKGGKIK